ncbi:hypothetical protein [Anaeromicrobium sediminis]|uniref:Spore coat protein n=1 Tax=Anaeromicrobium sediminis TaxID=1478221 RepID=A0A267MK56_9FIRM|nr:hypothetical protein [Anaeromicrobium sediminis]PAB59298.1 hypothetical protein CCE28_10565 [Anaeromicrobium sediminis]
MTKNIDTHSLEILEEHMDKEYIIYKKFTQYANLCTDTQFKNLCAQNANTHKENFKALLNYLNGLN